MVNAWHAGRQQKAGTRRLSSWAIDPSAPVLSVAGCRAPLESVAGIQTFHYLLPCVQHDCNELQSLHVGLSSSIS